MKTINQIFSAYSFDFSPILLQKNSKIPIFKNWTTPLDFFEMIEKGEKYTGHNVGILCGNHSNVIIIDVDNRNNGINNWNEILDENFILNIDTPIVQTPSGGIHYYFKWDKELDLYKSKLSKNNKKYDGIDILKTGKQVVFPGSQINGKKYVWVQSPLNTTIKKLPEWLFSYFELDNRKIN